MICFFSGISCLTRDLATQIVKLQANLSLTVYFTTKISIKFWFAYWSLEEQALGKVWVKNSESLGSFKGSFWWKLFLGTSCLPCVLVTRKIKLQARLSLNSIYFFKDFSEFFALCPGHSNEGDSGTFELNSETFGFFLVVVFMKTFFLGTSCLTRVLVAKKVFQAKSSLTVYF